MTLTVELSPAPATRTGWAARIPGVPGTTVVDNDRDLAVALAKRAAVLRLADPVFHKALVDAVVRAEVVFLDPLP